MEKKQRSVFKPIFIVLMLIIAVGILIFTYFFFSFHSKSEENLKKESKEITKEKKSYSSESFVPSTANEQPKEEPFLEQYSEQELKEALDWLDALENETTDDTVTNDTGVDNLPHEQAVTSNERNDKPWKSDPEYQRLKQEIKRKSERRGFVMSRSKEITQRLKQLPRHGSGSDPAIQESLALSKELETLNWEQLELYNELMELWKAKEAIKKSYMEGTR